MTDWPAGMTVAPIREWPGQMTARRTRSNFSALMTDRLELLRRELRMLGAKNIELLVAIPAEQFRLDGYPRATARAEHPGIILSFDTPNLGHLSYPCDSFDRWEDNLYGVAKSLEALRMVDRYGVTKRGEQYRGFLALEATAMPSTPFTHEPDSILGWLMRIPGVETAAGDHIATVLRRAQRATHPDHGGDPEEFRLVTLAETYLREAGVL